MANLRESDDDKQEKVNMTYMKGIRKKAEPIRMNEIYTLAALFSGFMFF